MPGLNSLGGIGIIVGLGFIVWDAHFLAQQRRLQQASSSTDVLEPHYDDSEQGDEVLGVAAAGQLAANLDDGDAMKARLIENGDF